MHCSIKVIILLRFDDLFSYVTSYTWCHITSKCTANTYSAFGINPAVVCLAGNTDICDTHSDICWANMPLISHINRLSHWGRDKMAAIFQTIFSNGFSIMKIYVFRFRYHWILLKCSNLKIPALVHIMAWRRPGEKPLNEWWLVYWRIYVTRPQWVHISQCYLLHFKPDINNVNRTHST